MKTFQQFLEEAKEIQELFGFMEPPPKPAPKPKQEVLAYKNYKPGVLDKKTDKFIQRAHTGAEQQRYGWKPTTVSVYSTKDTPGNPDSKGVSKTADAKTVWNDKTKVVASPYKYQKGKTPKGEWNGTPNTPFGSNVNITTAPMGTVSGATKTTTSKVGDTGNFGRNSKGQQVGSANPEVKFDLSQPLAQQVLKTNKSADEIGKKMVYTKITPPEK